MNVVIQPDRVVQTALVVSLLCLGATGPVNAQDPLELMDQAVQSERRGDMEAALGFYDQVVSQFPDDEQAPVALLRVAEERLATGAVELAVEAVTRLREDYGDAPSAAGAYVLDGVMQLAAATGPDDLREAWNTFGNVVARFERSRYPEARWRREARMRRGHVAVLLGDLDLAAAEFLAIIEDEPLGDQTAEAQFELATILLYQGRWNEAAEILQRVVDRASVETASDALTGTSRAARRRLSLLHRMVLRPAVGMTPWTQVRRLQLPTEAREPIGVAASSDGRLLVADDRADLALLFSASGELVGRSAEQDLRLPWWGIDGEPYVLSRRAVVRPFGPASGPGSANAAGSVTFAVTDGGGVDRLDDLRAGARSSLGEWVILDRDRRQVVRFDRDGRYRATVVDRIRDQSIVDLDVDARGRLWLLDGEQNHVLRFGFDGTAEGVRVSHDWRRSEALAVDSLGNVYVLDREAKTVDVFGPDGAAIHSVGPVLSDGTELRRPRDLAVDGSGRLYIVDGDPAAVLILE